MLGDTLDYYRNDPMKWAVETALCSYFDGDMSRKELLTLDPEGFVNGALDFIEQAFEDEELEPPNYELLLRAVRKRMREIADEDCDEDEDIDEDDELDIDPSPTPQRPEAGPSDGAQATTASASRDGTARKIDPAAASELVKT